LQFQPAAAFKLETASQVHTLYASAPTLAGALWQAGIRLSLADATSLPPAGALTGSPVVTLRRAVPITILVSGGQIEGFSSAPTVGRALTDAGVSLQGLDYSVPAESEPIPSDGVLRVVRVREEVILEQKTIPFENEYAADPELELDQRNVLEAGQYGLQVNRLRVRYEDGKEINRQGDAEWVAAQPKKQVVGYGTRVVIRTTDTPDGPIEYWRAVRMYATSYSPCKSGVDRCLYGTASGMRVQKGVAAVLVRHFRIMREQRVYVSGYGSAVIGDTGGGIRGRLWIDLAYSDDDYQSWHSWTTVYFLTPVPAVIPYILN
ncbi:MAG: G5 domain-containing protein, partial [Anaerolineaceae bacterium]|nr:G5 domain-containing protein [Anaerolineaceae bacterium]